MPSSKPRSHFFNNLFVLSFFFFDLTELFFFFFFLCFLKRNHTTKNQTHKAHRNGIKKPKKQRFLSLEGVDPKFLRNQRFAKKYNKGGRPKVAVAAVVKKVEQPKTEKPAAKAAAKGGAKKEAAPKKK